MRVLHCIWRMGVGGAERQLALLAGSLVRQGIDVHVAVAFPSMYDAELRNAGATVHSLGGAAKYDVRVVPRLAMLMRRLRPAVVQTWMMQMDLCGGFAAEMLRIPLVLSERSTAEQYPPGLLHALRAGVGRRAAVVVPNSQHGARYWRNVAGRTRPIEIIPNAVPEEAIAAAPPREESRGQPPLILSVARFSPPKNLRLLVEAVRPIVESGRATALFAGEGRGRAVLEDAAGDLAAAGRIRFPGVLPDVWSWMKRAAVLACISHFESGPNVVLEAVACGTPLIVSDIPTHRDLLRDDQALFVDKDSPADVTRGILQILGDPRAAAARAAAARSILGGRSPAEIASRYARIYARAARHRHSVCSPCDAGDPQP